MRRLDWHEVGLALWLVGLMVYAFLPDATAQVPYRARCHPDVIAAARDLTLSPEPAHVVVLPGGDVCVIARR